MRKYLPRLLVAGLMVPLGTLLPLRGFCADRASEKLSRAEKQYRFRFFYSSALKSFYQAQQSESEKKAKLLDQTSLYLKNCLSLVSQDTSDYARARRLLDVVEKQLARLGATNSKKTPEELTELNLRLLDMDYYAEEARRALDQWKFDEAKGLALKAIQLGRGINSHPRAQRLLRDLKVFLRDLEKERELLTQISIADSRERAVSAKALELKSERDIVRRFKEHAEKLINNGEYERARALTRQFRTTHPDNPLAVELLERIRERERKALERRVDKRHQEIVDLTRKEQIPPEPGTIVQFPPDWQEKAGLKERTHRAPSPYADLLSKRVNLSFQDNTMEEVALMLRDLTDMNVILDPSVTDRKVTLDVQNMTLGSALYWLCRTAKIDYTIQDEAIFFSDKNTVRDRLITKRYDISDLLFNVEDLGPYRQDGTGRPVQPKLSFSSAEGEVYRVSEEDVHQQANDIVDLIKSVISPDLWEPSGQAGQQPQSSIRIRGTQLLVRTFPDVHREIQELLDELRQMRAILVSIVTRFITINNDFLERLNISWTGVPGGPTVPGVGGGDITAGYISPPDDKSTLIIGNVNSTDIQLPAGTVSDTGGISLSWTYLDDFQVALLLNAVYKKRKGNVLTSPRLTCFNTQRASLVIGTFRNYVESISADGEPTIAQAPTTVVLDVQPFVSADRRFITVVLRPTITETISLEAFTYTVARETDEEGAIPEQRTIQQPTIFSQVIRTTISVPNGGSILIGGLARAHESLGYATFPIVHSIPLLKYLFRSWGKADSRSSLILLVRAEVIDLEQEAESVR